MEYTFFEIRNTFSGKLDCIWYRTEYREIHADAIVSYNIFAYLRTALRTEGSVLDMN